MTKEEAIENIKLIRFNAAITNANSFKEALDMAIEALSQRPSLPSELDEAALKELQVYLPQGNGPDGICYFIAPQMLAMYKAGAELMAGQGVSVDGLFGIRGIESNNIVDAMLGGGLKMGDKVIVQIRKK